MTESLQQLGAQLGAQLDCSRDQTLAAFHAPLAQLDRPYAPGKWTGRQMLLHIVDCETSFLDRLKRLLADPKPLLWALDPDAWNARLAFPTRSLTIAKTLFLAQRAAVHELLESVNEAEWSKLGVHSEAGKVSVREVATKVIAHNVHHLAQVEAAIAGRTWIKAG